MEAFISEYITLKQLNVFFAVANTGSITHASDQLFITKSAVSIALNSLELQLGQPLFDRVKNRLVLNSQGTELLPLVDEMLLRSQNIQTMFSSDKLSGNLRIGASVTIGNHLLPSLLGSYLDQANLNRPVIKIENTAKLIVDLKNYNLDIALVEGKVIDDTLLVIPWLRDQMHIIASAQHPLTANLSKKHNSGLPVQGLDLSNQKWVLREPNSGTREQFDVRIAPYIGPWSIGLELNSNEAVINSVASGIGLGFMSNLSVEDATNNHRLIKLLSNLNCERQLYIVFLNKRYISPLMQSFIDFSLTWQPEN